ncbi:MAG: TldD/PmbA family protein [Thermoplasmata archaeon]|nr:TldD/PmbA family protein [Thermoplasmata archaeon]
MSEEAFTAFHVGDKLRGHLEPPWEVYGERLKRYELHLNGGSIEMERGPLQLEGFGLRLFRPHGEQLGVGFVSTTDLSAAGISRASTDAEATAKFARFPARRVELPSTLNGGGSNVETVDTALWNDPTKALADYVHALLTPFEGRAQEVPSFGSVRASLSEATLTNSEGIQRRVRRTQVDLEIAVKSSGGPEGRPPGEYWVTRRTCDLSTRGLAGQVDTWCQRARDVRVAEPMPSGIQNVVLPPAVLADVLPAILGYRMSGSAELRKMAPTPGEQLAAPGVSIFDDGLLRFGLGSAPYDDEGSPQVRRSLVDKGVIGTPAYDLLHASALDHPPTGNGHRGSPLSPNWFHFAYPPSPSATNLVVVPGDGGSEEELLESARDGLLLDQLGYAFPDPVSGAFGGEVRIGYRIRNGRRAEPVRGGTVGGVVLAGPGEPSLLNSIKGIGRTGHLEANLQAPTLWVAGLGVAGAG